MSTELVTAIFAGLVSLLTAVAGVLAQRAKTVGASRRDLREARDYIKAADRWIYMLERGYSRQGLALPDGKPKELTEDDDDDATQSIPRAN